MVIRRSDANGGGFGKDGMAKMLTGQTL